MIIDRLKNISLYKNIPADIIDFLSGLDDNTFLGKYYLSNGNYVNLETYKTKSIPDGKFESHKNYIDIQFLVRGKEKIFVTDSDNLSVSISYNAEKDIMFYSDSPEDKNFVILDGTNFVMLFPHEAHAPQILVDNENMQVIKAVAKIKI